jgi:hypothetical protein
MGRAVVVLQVRPEVFLRTQLTQCGVNCERINVGFEISVISGGLPLESGQIEPVSAVHYAKLPYVRTM